MSQAQTSANSQNNPGSTRLLIVALCVAVVAVILVNIYIGVVRSESTSKTFTVYRLNHAVEIGDELEQDDLDASEVPIKFKDALRDAVKKSDVSGKAEEVGEAFTRPARTGQLLSYGQFRRDQGQKLEDQIDPGMRVVALPVNSDILPVISPGARVDIQAPFSGPKGGVQILAVMENVEVLAVGRRSILQEREGSDRHSSRNFDKISIELEESQVAAMSKIQKAVVGDFELSVRNPGDTATPKIPSGGINPKVLKKVGINPAKLQLPASGS